MYYFWKWNTILKNAYFWSKNSTNLGVSLCFNLLFVQNTKMNKLPIILLLRISSLILKRRIQLSTRHQNEKKQAEKERRRKIRSNPWFLRIPLYRPEKQHLQLVISNISNSYINHSSWRSAFKTIQISRVA